MTTDAYVKLTRAVRSSIPAIASQMNITLNDGVIDDLIDDVVFAMDESTAASIYFQQEQVTTARITKLIESRLLAYVEPSASASEHEWALESGVEVLDG